MEINVENLEILADFMEKVPPERLNLRSWVGSNWEGLKNPAQADSEPVWNLHCGTSACMFGWATTIKKFRDMGLRMKVGRIGPTVYAYPAMVYRIDGKWSDNKEIEYAAEVVFGLDPNQTWFLFDPSVNGIGEHASPAAAADLIHRFIKDPSIIDHVREPEPGAEDEELSESEENYDEYEYEKPDYYDDGD